MVRPFGDTHLIEGIPRRLLLHLQLVVVFPSS